VVGTTYSIDGAQAASRTKAGTKCAQLEQYGKVCKDHGMALAYDNHTHEFANPRAENRGIVDHSGTYSEYIRKVFGV